MQIPEGGGTNVSCQYSDPSGIARVVDFFRGSIRIDDSMQQCGCVSTTSGTKVTLTFSDFMNERDSGDYGCWATIPEGFAQCDFYVTLPGN